MNLKATRLAGLWMMGLIIVGLAACSPAEPSSMPTQPATQQVTVTPTVQPSPVPLTDTLPPPPEAVGPDSYPADINPLTGLRVSDPSLLARRPLLIKISNAPPVVRPQSGINLADLLFEHYAEGGQTRFSALFYSRGAEHVGSVRSTRLVDLQLAPAFDAILIFSGGSLGVIDTLRASKLYPNNVISPQFGYGAPYFVRFPREGLPFEHTLFTDTTALWQWAQARKIHQQPEFHAPGMAFRMEPSAGGVPASALRIDYARTQVMWRYDALSGAYLRWSDGVPHTDALTGAQLALENVVVISAYHAEVDLFPEKYFGKEKSIQIDLEGEGPATLFRDGLAFEGRWHHAQPRDMLSFTDLSGATLYLKPGRTFFQIIRSGFEQVMIEP